MTRNKAIPMREVIMSILLVAVIGYGVYAGGQRTIIGVKPSTPNCSLDGKQYSNGSTASVGGKSVVCSGGRWIPSAASVQSEKE